MSLIERVRLEIERAGTSRPGLPATPDFRPLVVKLIELRGESVVPHGDPRQAAAAVERAHRQWLTEGRLWRLAANASAEIAALWPNALPGEHASDLEALVTLAVAASLDMEDARADLLTSGLTVTRRTLLREIARRSDPWIVSNGSPSRALRDPHRYAVELGLLQSGRPTRSATGFLRLTGRQASKWLLGLELVRSHGALDAWRCGPDVARALLRILGHHFQDQSPEHESPLGWDAMLRWGELGVVDTEFDFLLNQVVGYELTVMGRELLTELTSEPSPALELIRAIDADVGAEALLEIGGVSETAARHTVAHAIVRQSNAMAHELRNKLAPLETAFSILADAVDSDDKRGVKARELARQSVADLFAIVDRVVEQGRELAEPEQWFDVASALRDGVASGRNGRADAVVCLPETTGWQLRGPRQQFVIAVANLIRNAIQAADTRAVRIDIRCTTGPSSWMLCVDDDGPGIPDGQRLRVFARGHSTRHGGTGLGLHMVREVVESEFGGTVLCGASPSGGARFEVTLPATRLRPFPTEMEREP